MTWTNLRDYTATFFGWRNPPAAWFGTRVNWATSAANALTVLLPLFAITFRLTSSIFQLFSWAERPAGYCIHQCNSLYFLQNLIIVYWIGAHIHQNRRAHVYHQLLRVAAMAFCQRELHSFVGSPVSRGSTNFQFRCTRNQLAELRWRLLSWYTSIHLKWLWWHDPSRPNQFDEILSSQEDHPRPYSTSNSLHCVQAVLIILVRVHRTAQYTNLGPYSFADIFMEWII